MAKNPVAAPVSPLPTYDHGGGVSRSFPAVAGGLYSLQATPPIYKGGFVVDANPAGTSSLTYTQDAHRIAQGSAAGRILITGQNLGTGGQPHFAEATRPALVAGSNVNAFNIGAIVQPFRDIKTDAAGFPGDAAISGMEFDRVTHPLDPSRVGTGQIVIGAYSYYAGNTGKNFGLYRNGSNIASSVKFNTDMTGGAHFSGQMIKIPASWRSLFGGATHFAHNGIGMAIVGRASNGPSLLAFTMPEAGESPALINGTVVMDFPLANPLCGTETEMNTAQIWNHLTRVAGGFCIPNTDTIMFVGHNWDPRFVGGTIDYKKTNDIGVTSNGYAASKHQAYSDYYWLFSKTALAAVFADPIANPPHMVRPYEHNFFPQSGVSNWQHLMTGAYYDYDTNEMVASIWLGAASRFAYSAAPSFAAYQLV
ncbi:MAG: hypothetical protein HPY82_05695 [Gammaproteobacteria bacterium]|nr:hypothetical protein [Gammaproteobacteria bacterium]